MPLDNLYAAAGGRGGGSPGLQSPQRQQQATSYQSAHPGAVIAGGAGGPRAEGAGDGSNPEERPDPIANHPRYRKVRDLNW